MIFNRPALYKLYLNSDCKFYTVPVRVPRVSKSENMYSSVVLKIYSLQFYVSNRPSSSFLADANILAAQLIFYLYIFFCF
jgi:hypothetical protein